MSAPANDNGSAPAPARLPEFQVLTGDSLELLRQLPDACVDSLVTDPPAGIGFMGKEWDSDKGGRVQWIAWLQSVLAEALRVLKPGAHGVIWAIPKTSHWTATAAEVAGFEIRDVIDHHFGTGFPKSLNISKAIDEAAGAERTIIGQHPNPAGNKAGTGSYMMGVHGMPDKAYLTAPATDAAKQWDGWGTALKPATEHWILVRKPLAVDGAAATVAANVQAHGTGGLNIDECRIGTTKDVPASAAKDRIGQLAKGDERGRTMDTDGFDPNVGRWPANLVLSHTEWCEPLDAAGAVVAADEYGEPCAAVVAWRCLHGCPVALLDAQSGQLKAGGKITPGTAAAAAPRVNAALGTDGRPRGEWPGHGDAGGASRFFYVSKPSGKEREEGLAHLPKRTGGEMVERAEGSAGINNPRAGAGRTSKGRANFHPTVKSIGLMSWLVKLITPPSRPNAPSVVLDPFTGSGSTGVAAVKYGCDFLGIEKDPDFVRIAEARIAYALGAAPDAPAQISGTVPG